MGADQRDNLRRLVPAVRAVSGSASDRRSAVAPVGSQAAFLSRSGSTADQRDNIALENAAERAAAPFIPGLKSMKPGNKQYAEAVRVSALGGGFRTPSGKVAESIARTYQDWARGEILKQSQLAVSAVAEYNRTGKASVLPLDYHLQAVRRYHNVGGSEPGHMTLAYARSVIMQQEQDAKMGGLDHALNIIALGFVIFVSWGLISAAYAPAAAGGASGSAEVGLTNAGGGLADTSGAVLSGGAGSGQGLSVATLNGSITSTTAVTSGSGVAVGTGDMINAASMLAGAKKKSGPPVAPVPNGVQAEPPSKAPSGFATAGISLFAIAAAAAILL